MRLLKGFLGVQGGSVVRSVDRIHPKPVPFFHAFAKNQIMRHLLCLLLSFAFLSTAQSQSFFDGFGVKGGLNIATIHGGNNDFNDGLSPKTYFHVGVYKDFWLDLDWNIRAELLYSVKGAQNRLLFNTPGGNESDVNYRASYLSVPILAQFARGNFKFGAGPQIGYLLNEKLIVDGESSDGVLYDNNFDIGIAGNITYTLLMIDVELRYIYGLTNITDIQFTDPNGSPIGSSNLHNGVLQVSLGLRIF